MLQQIWDKRNKEQRKDIMEQMEVIEAQQNIVNDGQQEEEGIVDAETYGGVRTTVRDPGSNRTGNEDAPEETKEIKMKPKPDSN